LEISKEYYKKGQNFFSKESYKLGTKVLSSHASRATLLVFFTFSSFGHYFFGTTLKSVYCPSILSSALNDY